jgi:hypothetical protein
MCVTFRSESKWRYCHSRIGNLRMFYDIVADHTELERAAVESSNGFMLTSCLIKIGQIDRNLKFIRTCRTRMVNSGAFFVYFKKKNGEMTGKSLE